MTAVTVLELLDIAEGLWAVAVGGPPVHLLAIYITSKRIPMATFTVDTHSHKDVWTPPSLFDSEKAPELPVPSLALPFMGLLLQTLNTYPVTCLLRHRKRKSFRNPVILCERVLNGAILAIIALRIPVAAMSTSVQ